MPGTVCVGCKIPNGLKIAVFNMEEHQEPILGGGWRTVKRAVQAGDFVKLNGPARRVGMDAPHEIRNGVGLTFGVDADFFAEWSKRPENTQWLKGGLVFAHVKSGDVSAQAKERAAEKTGLEPIDPKNLPAEFRGKIATADVAA